MKLSCSLVVRPEAWCYPASNHCNRSPTHNRGRFGKATSSPSPLPRMSESTRQRERRRPGVRGEMIGAWSSPGPALH
ncbi:unnamed protein product, partial [Mycena citricolor]